MKFMRAEKPLNFTLETESTTRLLRLCLQKSYKHQRRVMGLDRNQARKLVIDRQNQINNALAEMAVKRLAKILPAALKQLRNVD